MSGNVLRHNVLTLNDQMVVLEEATQAALRNESITRARVEALEARLTLFESMPLRKRLTWLLRGR